MGGLSVQLHNAGHLPGSVLIVVEGEGKRLVYSGDLGNRQKMVLPDPDPAPKADLVLVEGTYGDRPHRSFKATVEEFVEILERILGQGGKVYIPTFAVERAQEILFHIFQNQNRLPKAPIFLDSPMANRVSRLYPI
ncbi:MAG: MBL fold metallo-hydrolase [Thermoanaerobaculaceae bacterium]